MWRRSIDDISEAVGALQCVDGSVVEEVEASRCIGGGGGLPPRNIVHIFAIIFTTSTKL